VNGSIKIKNKENIVEIVNQTREGVGGWTASTVRLTVNVYKSKYK
jgi:hypothetical protein